MGPPRVKRHQTFVLLACAQLSASSATPGIEVPAGASAVPVRVSHQLPQRAMLHALINMMMHECVCQTQTRLVVCGF